MNDSQTTQAQTTTDPAALIDQVGQTPPSSGQKPAGKNPLDALEDLLKDAKAKKSGGAGAKQQSKEEKKKTEERVDAEELAKIKVMEEQQQQVDQGEIKQQLINLQKEVQTSPQQKAREEQDQEKKQNDTRKEQEREDCQIRQLGHTKI